MRQVILDGNNLLFAAAATTGHLTNGTVFGFLNIIRASMKRFGCEGKKEYLIAWDVPSWRKEFYPEYKANRVDEEDLAKKKFIEDMKKQKKILEQFFFPYIPVLQVTAKGYEADDIAAFYSSLVAKQQSGEAILVSNDKDWIQLVHETCSVYRPKRDVLITPQNFEEITGLQNVEQFIEYLIFMGDSVDNIEGCYGVGEVTAKKYVRGELLRGKKYDDIQEFIRTGNYYRNRNLIDMRFREQENHPFEIEYPKSEYNPDEFFKSCQFWKMASFIAKQDEWQKLLESWN